MKITRYLDQKIKVTTYYTDVEVRYDKESSRALQITLKPGEGLRPYKTSVNVLFFILEGVLTFNVGNECKECNVDTLVESPANTVHSISNDSNRLARILVVKPPRPVGSVIKF